MAIKLEETDLGTLNIRGDQIFVYVSTDSDEDVVFTATLNEVCFQDRSLKGLKARLHKASERSVLSYPVSFFMMTDADEFKDMPPRFGQVYSIHAGNGNALVEWGDGSKGQMTVCYRASTRVHYLRGDVTPEQLKYLDALKVSMRAERRAYEEFRDKLSIDLRESVEESRKG